MPTLPEYQPHPISRSEIDALDAPVVVEFGTNWCGICRAAAPLIESAFADHPQIRHLRIEDGPGRRLGRSFGVKLWPTLVFMHRGRELSRVVRPTDAAEIGDAISALEAVQ